MQNNKVCVNIDQSNPEQGGFTDEQKQQARTNIGAGDGKVSWVQYSQGSPYPTVDRSPLSVVSSDTGTRIQNEDASKKFYVAPNFNADDYGKVLRINKENQKVMWDNPPVPPKDVFMEMKLFDMTNNPGNDKVVKQYQCPVHNGKYPTKIIGSFECNPSTDHTTLSVMPLNASLNAGYNSTSTPYDSGQNHNVTHLLALDESSQNPTGQYGNTVSFMFHKVPNRDGFDMKYVGIKGGYSTGYDIHNVNLTFIYEED